jgi:hypothetical protein
MTYKEQIKTIREAYSDLQMLGLQDGFFTVAGRLLEMNLAAERRHRRGAPAGIKHGLTVKDAAKLFTCSHLLDGYNQPDKWTVDDILCIRTECLYAQAYAKKHNKELADWALQYTGLFEQIDYAELQRHGQK